MTIRSFEAQLKKIDIHANPDNELVTIHNATKVGAGIIYAQA